MLSPRIQSAMDVAREIGGPSFAKEAQHYGKLHERLLTRLKTAVASGNKTQIKKAKQQVFKSYASKVSAALRGLSSKQPRPTREDLMEQAALSAFHDCGETVFVKQRPKDTGNGYRWTSSFGPKRRMFQRLVADVVETEFGTDPRDLMAAGRGPEVAADWIVKTIKAGAPYAVIADIKKFYPSVQLESVWELIGLPKAVGECCVRVGPEVPIRVRGPIYDSTDEWLDGEPPRGLPQGSLASTVIAGVLLGRLLAGIAPVDRYAFNGDDIAIFACSKLEAVNAKKSLAERLAAHPGGALHFKYCKIHHINGGINFCKYFYRQWRFGGRVKVTPSHRSWDRYKEKYARKYAETPRRGRRARLNAYMENWRNSFRRWKIYPGSQALLEITGLLAIQDKGLAYKKALVALKAFKGWANKVGLGRPKKGL